MDTNKMELSMDEMEMVNGGKHGTDYKVSTIGTMAGAGAIGGAGAGACIGSMIPVVGTVVGGAVGGVIGAAVGGGIAAIHCFFFDD